jgi:uncharacterized protein (TIGR00251 family)
MKTDFQKKSEVIESAVLTIRVVPGASRSKITTDDNTKLKIYLSSPPVDGLANKECIKLLSKFFKISKSSIVITHGKKQRTKTISFYGISQNDAKVLIDTL